MNNSLKILLRIHLEKEEMVVGEIFFGIFFAGAAVWRPMA